MKFDSPLDDSGESPTGYRTGVDTSSTFNSGNGMLYGIADRAVLYSVQQVTVSAAPEPEVQQRLVVKEMSYKQFVHVPVGLPAGRFDGECILNLQLMHTMEIVIRLQLLESQALQPME